MKRIFFLAAAFALVARGECRAYWQSNGSSLVLYDSSGTVLNEIGLGEWEEPARSEDGKEIPDVYKKHSARHGISSDRRFAWTFQTVETIKRARISKTLSRTRVLRYYGLSADEFWNDTLAEAPRGLDPIVLSEKAEIALVAENVEHWRLAAYSFTGNRIMEAVSKGEIEQMAVSPNGRYAAAKISPEKDPKYFLFMDLETKQTRELPATELPYGPLKLDDAGGARVSDRTVEPFKPKEAASQ